MDLEFERATEQEDAGDATAKSKTSGRFASGIFVSQVGAHDIDEQLGEAKKRIINRVENFQSGASGWIISDIIDINLHTAMYNPIAAGSYIKTPQNIRNKGAVLNIKTIDRPDCFALCVLAHIHPCKKRNSSYRPQKYRPYMGELNMKGIEQPVTLESIPKFEARNPTISIGVLCWDKDSKAIVPIYTSKHRTRAHHVNLYLLYGTDSRGKIYTISL